MPVQQSQYTERKKLSLVWTRSVGAKIETDEEKRKYWKLLKKKKEKKNIVVNDHLCQQNSKLSVVSFITGQGNGFHPQVMEASGNPKSHFEGNMLSAKAAERTVSTSRATSIPEYNKFTIQPYQVITQCTSCWCSHVVQFLTCAPASVQNSPV